MRGSSGSARKCCWRGRGAVEVRNWNGLRDHIRDARITAEGVSDEVVGTLGELSTLTANVAADTDKKMNGLACSGTWPASHGCTSNCHGMTVAVEGACGTT